MLRCTPFMLFDGECAAAMTFYQECLGGDLTITTLRDSPMKEFLPPDRHGRTINAHLLSGDIEISAADWMASPARAPVLGNTTAIFVIGDDIDEMSSIHRRLSVGADASSIQELHDMPIGTYGQLYDRYGVQWIFLSRPHPS